MLSEQKQDGYLLTDPLSQPTGRAKRIFHVNGVSSDVATQQRDLETLVWLTVEQPMDIIGIHNSTHGLQADLLESMLGKAELFRFWSSQRSPQSLQRLEKYSLYLQTILDDDLPADVDILEVAAARNQQQERSSALDIAMLRRLSQLPSMTWDTLESALYGPYPAGAPRPTLRLAYEVINSLRSGTEVFIVAHSQGLIIAALALHIVQQFFGNYQKWASTLRIIGYGSAILLEDLPETVRSQTIMIQHRYDLVAASFSDSQNANAWSSLQTQAWKLIERADHLVQLIGTDSHHSASFYLGLTGHPTGDRSAQLIQRLLLSNWSTDPIIHSLKAARITLDDLP